MSDIISDAGLVKTLRARFGIRGDTDLGLASEIIPTASLGDLDGAPWHSKGGGVCSIGLGAVAAQLAYVGIRVPLTLPNNFRAVVRAVGIGVGTAGGAGIIKLSNSASVDALLGAPTLAAVAGSWDSPEPDQAPKRTPLSTFTVSTAVVLAGDGILMLNNVINQSQFFYGTWNVAPGNTLYVQSNTLNSLLQAMFYWDEYYIG